MKKELQCSLFHERMRKFFLIMRLITVLLLGAIIQVSANSAHSQNVMYEFELKNASFEDLMNTLLKKSDYYFIYKNQDVAKIKNLNFNFSSSSITEILDKCIEGTDLTYTIDNQLIIIKTKDKVETTFALPQTLTIKGKVVDKNDDPIPGVSVVLKSPNVTNTIGTATDIDGNFSINFIESPRIVLVFTFIGMLKKEVVYNNEEFLRVELQEAVESLDDVVVLGYGTVRQKDFTGSVSSVRADEIKDIPYISIDNALAGKASGVNVIKADGSPGGAVRIRVRGGASLLGTNDPLYVIDGIPMVVSDNYMSGENDIVNPIENYGEDRNSTLSGSFGRGLNNLAGLNIGDIETIDILKDASATAIYGSKAANGVVIITTKKGRKESKPTLNMNYYLGINIPNKEKVLNAKQYKDYFKVAAQNLIVENQRTQRTSNQAIAEAIVNDPDFFGEIDTDWMDLVLRNGFTQNIDVSVSGGSEHSRYYTSISYTDQVGTVIKTDFKRISGKISLDTDLAEWFRLSTNMNFSYTKTNITNGIYSQALYAPPIFPVYNEDGTFTSFDDLGYSYDGFQNPMALASGINYAKDYLLLGSMGAEIRFLRDFKFNSTVSVNLRKYDQFNYVPSYVNVGTYYGKSSSQGGEAVQANSTNLISFFENTLTWNKEFNQEHRLNLLLGTSWESNRLDEFSATANGFPDDVHLNNLGSAMKASGVSGANPVSESYLLSFFVRGNYVWKDKYLFTFTGRSDKSSKFAPANQTGYFPSGAIAWRISEEEFLNKSLWIDEIKIRASIGKTGTQSIGSNMWRTLYSVGSYGDNNALFPSQLGNSKIKWESTVQQDLGLDFSFFNSRLGGTIGYYNKVTDGALLNMTPAPSSAYSTVVYNICKIRNRGIELDLYGDFIRNDSFKWNGSVNISRNISKVLNIAGNPFSDPNDRDNMNLGTSMVKEGEPLGLLVGNIANGIIKSQEQLDEYMTKFPYATWLFPYLNIGDIEYDIDETGFYYQDVIGKSAPKFHGGYTNTFTYKGLSLSALFTFSYGGELIYQKDVRDFYASDLSNKGVRALNYYSATNINTNRPRVVYGEIGSMLTNLQVYNASYLKLKSLNISYIFPKVIATKLYLNNLSIYGSATNLFTLTGYPGPDPEVSDDTGSVIGGGRDASTYPTVKSFVFGIRITL